MSVACPLAPPEGWWSMILLLGRAIRFPFVPAQRSREPMLAACPRHRVEISGLMYCMVS